jgi:alpha-aminoadipate carrier protein LysW
MIRCPECETELDIDEDGVDEGEVVTCPECGNDYEVITINPVELKLVEDEGYEDDEEEVAAEEEEE